MAATYFLFITCFTFTFVSKAMTLTSPNITFHLPEELKNNTMVGSIIEELDLGSSDSQQLDDLRFNFQSPPPIVKELFRIDTKSSRIYTKTKIDREREGLCPFKEICIFDFNVLIGGETTNYFKSIQVRINITDENDNTPEFQKTEMVLNLSESTAVHSSFFLETAQDLDGGINNSLQSYHLTSVITQTDFILKEEKSSIDGSPTLNLVVNKTLDHERKTYYELLLLAKDGGTPRRTGTLTIKVNIVDENDNKPIFKDSSVNITVKEDTQPGTGIFKLTATDKDSGKNGEIVYRFRKAQPQEIYNLFSIGESDGQLKVKGKLVYIPGKIYLIIVEATDKGNNPKFAQAVIRVNVSDSGNNPPTIDMTFLHGTPEAVSISEGAELGQFVAWAQVTDQDTGSNGEVTCSASSTYFGLALSGTKAYKVFVQHKLDRETIPEHNVSVTCHDKGTPQMDASVTFTVKVTDENDNKPRFSEHYYSISMKENNQIGKAVITVLATDSDEGSNGEVHYAIEPPSDTRFQINPISGTVTANEVFDRESTAHVTFTVMAFDKGKPEPLNSTATVVVDIEDLNDNKPEFLQMVFRFDIKENLPAGTPVDSVTAVDKDQKENGQITYRLHHNLDKNSIPFEIFPTGEIKTTQKLDREDLSRYDFFVEAFDNGTPSLTSSTQVAIFVLDANDNVPQFIFPNKDNYTITVPHSTPVDSIIASVQAYDMDDGENGKVMFFIRSGDVDSMFYLNYETGSLYIKKEFKITADKQYTLTLQVKDRGSPVVRSTERDLHILVKYVNVTKVPEVTGEENKFVLIVVSVVCVTMVLSVGLVAVICVLRRWDKDKNNNASLSIDMSDGGNTLPNLYDAAPTNNQQKTYPVPPNNKSKAKVSFSLEGKSQPTFNRNQLLQKLTGSSTGYKPEESYSKGNDMEKLVVRIPSVNKPPQGRPNDKPSSPLHEKQTIIPKTHREDSPSETSGETVASADSGHGGSEEDFQNSMENAHHKTFEINPLFVQGKDTPGIYVIRQHSKGSNSDVPIAKTPSPLDKKAPYPGPYGPNINHYLDDSLLTGSVNSTASYPSQNSQKNVVHTLPTIPSNSDINSKSNSSFEFDTRGPIFFSKDVNIYGSHSAYSRDDDDATTTSGSYTINPDDFVVEEFLSRPKDLYV